MSRSRIDWDKAKREQNAKKPPYGENLEKHFQEGIPAALQETVRGQKLKPLLVEAVESRKSSPEVSRFAAKLIRSSRIRVMDRDNRKDGACWVQCEMQFRCEFARNN